MHFHDSIWAILYKQCSIVGDLLTGVTKHLEIPIDSIVVPITMTLLDQIQDDLSA